MSKGLGVWQRKIVRILKLRVISKRYVNFDKSNPIYHRDFKQHKHLNDWSLHDFTIDIVHDFYPLDELISEILGGKNPTRVEYSSAFRAANRLADQGICVIERRKKDYSNLRDIWSVLGTQPLYPQRGKKRTPYSYVHIRLAS